MTAEEKGPRAIDAVRSSYSGQKHSIKVPEWNDLELFFAPITVEDMEFARERKPESTLEQSLLLLIHMAKDAAGAPLFQMGDMHYLKTEADFTILNRVISFMWAGADSIEDAEEELEKNQVSASD